MMFGITNRIVASAMLALSVSGCAINALRKEYAGQVALASDAATDGIQKFLDQVDTGRRETNITLASIDPACSSLAPVLRLKPAIGPMAPSVGFLCVDMRQPNAPAGNPISLVRISDDLEPTLKLAASLAAYGDGLAAIVEDDPVAASKPLLDALSLARAAQDAAKAIMPSAPDGVPAADDPRIAAAASLIDFIGGLVREAEQVKQLRAYLAEHPEGVSSILGPLKRQLGSWERARLGDAGLIEIVTDAQIQSILLAHPPASPAERHAALEQYYAYDKHRLDEAKLAPALMALLDAVETADSDLGRVIVDHPNLSRNERIKVATLNRERIIAALKRVADLAKAIRGA